MEWIDGVNVYRNTANRGSAYVVAPVSGGAAPTVDQLRHVDSTMALRVQTPISGWLVIGSPAFPGWTAQVDGNDAPVALIEGVLPAIRLEPGTHEVIYQYTPQSVQIGSMLSSLGVLPCGAWLAALTLVPRVMQRRRRKHHSMSQERAVMA